MSKKNPDSHNSSLGIWAIIAVVLLIVCAGLAKTALDLYQDNKATMKSQSQNTTASQTQIPVVATAQPEEPVINQYTLTTALDLFVYFANNINVLSFDSSVSYVNSSGIDFSKTAPTKDVTGTIELKDGNNELYIAFYPNKNNVETITTVNYSDKNYGITVDDGYHLYTKSFEIYDRNHEPHRKYTSSLDELIVFAYEHMAIPKVSTGTSYSVSSTGTPKAVSTPKPVNTPKPTNAPQPSRKSSSSSKSYDAVLDYGLDSVAIFATEDALKQYVSALSKSNRSTINDMIMNGEMAYVSKGTKCDIVKSKLTCVQVKLLDGTYEGNTVWVLYEAVQKK